MVETELIPDPKEFDVENRALLNKIRLMYFLAPDGSNREYFEKITNIVIKSLDNFYIGDGPIDDIVRVEDIIESDPELKEIIKNIEKTAEDKNLRFDGANLYKPAVDGEITFEEAKERFPKEFPKNLCGIEELLDILDKHTNPSIRFNPLFMGEIHPHGFIPAFEASIISTFLNHNVIAQKVSPSITYIERTVIEGLRRVVGYSPQAEDIKYFGGNIVSGGTIANLTAMVVARNKKLSYKRLNERGEEEVISAGTKGLIGILPYLKEEGYDNVGIFVSERAHYSLKEKIANVCGIGTENIQTIKTDSEGRMSPKDLEDAIKIAIENRIKPIAVIATAGTTEQGVIDPLREIGIISQSYGIYYHVDAAHGGGFLVSGLLRDKFRGIELADSITIDGHKMLYTYYPCGGIIFKDPEDPLRYIKQESSYLWNSEEHYSAGRQTIEGSRGTHGILQLYAGIFALGNEGYGIIHQHIINMTKYLHALIESSDNFRPYHKPETNILLYRYEPESLNNTLEKLGIMDQREGILNEINKQIPKKGYGKFYLGETEMDGRHYIKAVIMHPYTETETIDSYFDYVTSLGERITDSVISKRIANKKGESEILQRIAGRGN